MLKYRFKCLNVKIQLDRLTPDVANILGLLAIKSSCTPNIQRELHEAGDMTYICFRTRILDRLWERERLMRLTSGLGSRLILSVVEK